MGSIVAFLSIIIMIILHEWGHFIAARIFKVPVYEFAVGMGPLICSKKSKKGTQFTLRAIPIGGFCAFDDAKDSGIQDSALNKIPIYQKILICLAGPVMNLLTGFLIYVCLTLAIGVSVNTNTIHETIEDFPAYEVLQPGDIVTYIDNVKIDNINNTITDVVKDCGGKPLEVVYERDGVENKVTLTPKYEITTERYYLGIRTLYAYRDPVGMEYITRPAELTKNAAKQIYQSLKNLFLGRIKITDMSGIVGIISYAGEYATSASIFSFISLMAVVSVNLGIMNLLPIPGLDGSKIIIGIAEIICGGKRLPEKIESKLITVSFFILVVMMLAVMVSDIVKIIFK